MSEPTFHKFDDKSEPHAFIPVCCNFHADFAEVVLLEMKESGIVISFQRGEAAPTKTAERTPAFRVMFRSSDRERVDEYVGIFMHKMGKLLLETDRATKHLH